MDSRQGDTRGDSRQAPPGLQGLVDVALVQGALVARRLTQRFVELELDDEADEIPAGGQARPGARAEGRRHRAPATTACAPAPPAHAHAAACTSQEGLL